MSRKRKRTNETQSVSTADAFWAKIDNVPEFWQPVAYGAAFVPFVLMAKGIAFILPLYLIYLLFTSTQAFEDFGRILLAFLIATVGGALAGLSYTLLGRYIRRVPLAGPYVAGIVTVFPYALMLTFVLRIRNNESLLANLTTADFVIALIMASLFGPVLGYLLRDSDAPAT